MSGWSGLNGRADPVLRKHLLNGLFAALGVVIASHTSGGIHYDNGTTLLVVVVVLSVLNIFLKPLLLLFTIPFIILSLGLGLWVINGILLLLVGYLVDGFEVFSLLAALWGAFVISITSMIGNLLVGGKSSIRVRHSSQRQRGSSIQSDEDIIDV